MLIFHNIERSFESFYQISYIRGKHSVPYNQHFWKVSTQYIYSTPYVYSFESKCPPNMAIPYPTSIRYSRVCILCKTSIFFVSNKKFTKNSGWKENLCTFSSNNIIDSFIKSTLEYLIEVGYGIAILDGHLLPKE